MFGFGRKRNEIAPEAKREPDLPATEEFRYASGIAAERLSAVLTVIGAACQPGTTTLALHDLALREMAKRELTPTMKGTRGFPHEVSFCVNHVVCHGGPDSLPLKDGDLVTVQANARCGEGLAHLGWTFAVDTQSGPDSRIIQAGREAMRTVAEILRPGLYLGNIGYAIQNHIEKNGFSVVREYCGYGMGPAGIQDPQILCYGRPGTGSQLRENMIINVHVIVTAGRRHVRRLDDGWTVVTKDRSKSALFSTMFEVGTVGGVVLSRNLMP